MAQGRKTGGRKAGTPNRSSAELRAFIDAVADPEALMKELARIAREGEREETRVAAISQLLDRRYGRLTQAAAVALTAVPETDCTEALLEKLSRLAEAMKSSEHG
jgi:hypothetical protein